MRPTPPPTVGFQVVRTFPHARDAFTQGLYFEPGGTLLESTGLYGESSVRRVDLSSGRVITSHRLPARWFGEGITVTEDGRCIQLLWKDGIGLVRDVDTFAVVRTFKLPTAEGWGLTTAGDDLLLSDGTSRLRVLDSESFRVKRTITVRSDGAAVRNLNELQMVRGLVWANIWRDDRIAAIDPATGDVRFWVDMAPLLKFPERRRDGYEEVLNGIGYDAARDRLFVTGKCWETTYQIAVGSDDGVGPSAGHGATRGAWARGRWPAWAALAPGGLPWPRPGG